MNLKHPLSVGLTGALLLTLTGCPHPASPVTNATPTPAPATPTPAPTSTPGVNPQVFVSGTAIVDGILTMHVVAQGTLGRLAGATVALSGPTPAWGVTDGSQDLTFQPLEAGTYSVRISAPGYATQTLGSVTVSPQTGTVQIPNPPLSTTQNVTMVAQNGRALGHVHDTSGNPLAGAWVISDDNVAFTGPDGSYALSGLTTGSHTLHVGKTGYTGGSTTVSLNGADATAPDVNLASQAPVVSFENASQTFGSTTIASALKPLRDALTATNFTVSDGASNATIRVVASPTSGSIDAATVNRLESFVAGGGKLVLLGEWGGSLDYTPEALNQLAEAFGLAFNPDLVRSTQNVNGTLEWVHVPTFTGLMPAIDAMSSGVTVFDSCSLFVPPPAQGFAYAGTTGYRVADLGSGGPCLAAIRGFGAGIVICVGDTSAWTAGSITGNSGVTSNLGEANNRQFMLNLFRW